MQLQVATLLLCVRGATGLHARPALLLSPRLVSRLRSAAPVCADADGDSDELRKAKELAKFRRIRDEQDGEDDELAKARRRRDEQALQSEWGDGLSKNAQERDDALRADELSMLRQRIDLIETKETQIGEMKVQLRAMGAPLGLQLVNESDEITASAWVFVGLNVVVFLYAAYTLLVAPLANSASLLTGG
uniref:Uncharacterized protein n=1 Tax=Phaeocystis antarctica TaxID=33657 RepID=A0A7S0HVS9_9EUKA